MTTLPARSEYVVIGLGAAGAAAVGFLARAGAHVLGLDQYAPPHELGSSHGETRMLRTAYSEGPAYVPMVRRAITQWRELEGRTGTSLFRQTGVAYYGPTSRPFLDSAKEAARTWNVALDDRRAQEMRPGIAVPDDWQYLFDRDGGYLDCEAAISALLIDAKQHGARIVADCAVRSLGQAGDGVVIETDRGRLSARKVVVCAGAWAPELLPELSAVTHIERRVLHWFEDAARSYSPEAGFTPFLVEDEDGAAFYGFPSNAHGEIKIAEHFVAVPIDSTSALDRNVTEEDIAFIRRFSDRFLPGLGRHRRASVCMYPMSRDEHFIVDCLPDAPNVSVGAGLSGHGFKFAPVIGEALANFALERKQEIDVSFFSLKRFGEFT